MVALAVLADQGRAGRRPAKQSDRGGAGDSRGLEPRFGVPVDRGVRGDVDVGYDLVRVAP